MALLSVQGLSTRFFTDNGVVHAVEDVSFELAKGETLGIVGESGCGKTVMSLSLLRLLKFPPGKIVSGKIVLRNNGDEPVDITALEESQMQSIRGKRIAMIFQEPMTSLNPVFTIGHQIVEAISLHDGLTGKRAWKKCEEMLELVGIPDAARRANEYPHQLSGGMRQRAMIAMALSCKPDVLIADEPTTALDVTIQAQILDLMRKLKGELGQSMLLITHDLGVVAEMADRVLVMYAGRVVESGTAKEVFGEPKHPYTRALIEAVSALGKHSRGKKLPTIGGRVPTLIDLPKGCAFADRCPKAADRCRSESVPDDPCGIGRVVRCFFAG